MPLQLVSENPNRYVVITMLGRVLSFPLSKRKAKKKLRQLRFFKFKAQETRNAVEAQNAQV